MRKLARKRFLAASIGPRGWQSVVGPAAFALAALILLIFDHLQHRINEIVFWLTAALIASVFAWLVETNRKQSGALKRERRKAMNDSISGLKNANVMQTELEAALAAGEKRVLVMVELEDIQAYYDSLGSAAGDELVRTIAQRLMNCAATLAGSAYRTSENRFAVLVSADGSQLGEVALVVAGSLKRSGEDFSITGSHGEVALPEEATDPERATQIAGQRLAARKLHQARSARRQTYAVLKAALDARGLHLRDQNNEVAYRAIALGRRLGLGAEEIDDISLAAGLQDVGLLAVPESILGKATPLNDDEMTIVRQHPVAGAKIIDSAPALASVAKIVHAASERYDGSGLSGLSEDGIPLGSRIIAVAVAFTALTSARPYRSADGIEDALAELRRCTGTQFDPQVVAALAEELSEEGSRATPAPIRATTA